MNFYNCAGCGQVVETGAGFCPQCGRPQGAGAWEPQPVYGAPVGGYAAGVAAPATFSLGVQPFRTAGDALGPTFRLYREHFVPVGKIVLAATLPQVVVNYLVAQLSSAGWEAGAWVGMAVSWLMAVVIHSLMTGALIYAVVMLLGTGASPPTGESFRQGLKVWWDVLLCSLLVGVLTLLASLLLIIPGIILWVACSVALPALVVEARGPMGAVERSLELTSGYRWLAFLAMLLLWVVTAVVTYLTTGFGGGAFDTGVSFVVAFATAALQQMLGSASIVLSIFIYFGIRAARGEPAPILQTAAPAP
jgi:hypothetical protein